MKIILTAALLTLATATHGQAATLAESCDAGHRASCERLAIKTGGQCSSPHGLGGCRFDSLTTY